MTEVVGIRFKNGSKTYFFDPNGLQIDNGTDVIIETSRGIEYGICCEGNHQVEDSEVIQPLRPVIRLADDNDRKVVEENRKKEARAFQVCEEKIAAHQLDMKLVDVECNFEGNKILFFFTSDGRVDFRELVKDLAGVFRTRIELRQIGVRDEAKLLGGLGICGRPFCCSSFLDEFQPVSIKMAKTQNLSLNPTKISGTCGRLMCCLKYEQDAYEDLVKRLPKVNSPVETNDGPAVVSEVNLLRETVKLKRGDLQDKTLYKYDSETNTCTPVEEKRESDYFSDSGILGKLADYMSDTAPADAVPQNESLKRESEASGQQRRGGRNRRRSRSRAESLPQHDEQNAVQPNRPPRSPKQPAEPVAKREEGEQIQQSKPEQSRNRNHRRRRGNTPRSGGENAQPNAQPNAQQRANRAPQQSRQQRKPQQAKSAESVKGDGEVKVTGSSEQRRTPRSNKYKGRASNRPRPDKPSSAE